MPLTVDFVSLLLDVRQACADCGADLGIVPLAHAGTLELEPMCAVNNAVQDRVPDCVVAEGAVFLWPMVAKTAIPILCR